MQSNLSQMAMGLKNRDLSRVSKMANRLIWDLREKSMDMRMSPIGDCFSKFKRLTRDLGQELGKEVELFTEGGDTELDKTIIDRLSDPLVHIIRNCIDHGIESPAVREQLDKNRKGSIHLKASQSGPYILIGITDDGSGINTQAIKAQAIKKGFIKAEDSLSESALMALIFEPGFSTASAVTNVSGRGVGMDVVKKNIESLRGSIQIESHVGKGTTVTLKIPLTLVIIEGLLMKVEAEHFIVPLSAVERVVELKKEKDSRGTGGDIANIRGQLIPFIKLRQRFNLLGQVPDDEQMVILTNEGRNVGIVVDKVVGEYQTVIKSLGNVYKHIEGLSGATILGDGTIALILDAEQLVRFAQVEKQKKITRSIP